MGTQISDRYNLSQQLKVNKDGSIDVGVIETSIESRELTTGELKDLLMEVIHELKKINLHLQSITNEKIGEDDIECQ